jgi:hypothetical protein
MRTICDSIAPVNSYERVDINDLRCISKKKKLIFSNYLLHK